MRWDHFYTRSCIIFEILSKFSFALFVARRIFNNSGEILLEETDISDTFKGLIGQTFVRLIGKIDD